MLDSHLTRAVFSSMKGRIKPKVAQSNNPQIVLEAPTMEERENEEDEDDEVGTMI